MRPRHATHLILVVLSLLLAPVSGAALVYPATVEEGGAPATGMSEDAAVPGAPAGPAFGIDDKWSTLDLPDLPEAASVPAAGLQLPSLMFGDCGSFEDAGHWNDPMALDGPGSCDGTLEGGDSWDAYSIPVESHAVFNASLSITGSAEVILCIVHDPYTDYYETLRCETAAAGQPAHTATYVGEPGTWHILLQRSGGEATYRLSFDLHGWTTPGDCGEADASNHPENALPVHLPLAACEASLDPVLDQADWYALHLDAGQHATVTVVPNEDLDSDLCVYAAVDLSRPLDCSTLPVGDTDRVRLDGATSGDYLIRVAWWDGAGTYGISLAHAVPQDDCGASQDMGSRYQAAPVEIPLVCSGHLDPAAGDAWDAFRITPPERGMRIRLDAATEGVYACLYPAHSAWPVQCSRGGAGSDTIAYRASHADSSWIVGVRTTRPGTAYDLTIISFVPTTQNDCGSASDAGTHPEGAIPIADAVTCEGALLIDEGDSADAYTLTPPASLLEGTVRSSTPTFQTCLYIPTSGEGFLYRCTTTTTGELTFTVQVRTPGEQVTIVVMSLPSAAGSLDYDLALDVALPYSDCGTGGDAPGWWEETPPMLTPPVHACTGKLFGPSGDWGDHFRVHAEVGQVITILVEATEGDLWDACIWDAEGRGTCMMPNGYVPGEQGIANHVVTTAGDHTIGLDGWSDDDITYQLSVYVH